MSMTYYAVTDDPNELAHFGILGMKWGRRRTPEQLGHPRHSGSRSRKPRSAAYKKASGKLSNLMKSGIKKAEAHWKAYNSPKAREQRFMDKAMQKARNGTLKYGKLTDDQVRRITDRLALERNARSLGSTENPSYLRRLGSAVGEGFVRGLGQGTTSYIDERLKGRGRVTAEIKGEQRKAKWEASRKGQKTARREAENEIAREYYKTAYEEGDDPIYGATSNRARYLAEVKERNKKKDYEASLKKTYDEGYARQRAQYDSKREDDAARAARSKSNELKPTQVTYLDPVSGKKRTGSRLEALNAYNNLVERSNKYGSDYYDSMNASLSKIRADEARNREKARSDKAFNEALRQKQRQDAERESARVARERERQARIDAQNTRRVESDSKNTSRRKRNGRR